MREQMKVYDLTDGDRTESLKEGPTPLYLVLLLYGYGKWRPTYLGWSDTPSRMVGADRAKSGTMRAKNA